MSCNSVIHDELKAMGNSISDFCDVKLVDDILKQEDPCYEKIDLIKDDGMNVCKNCGVVNGYDLQALYIDFHDNKYKIRRKSVYIRKYHFVSKVYSKSLDEFFIILFLKFISKRTKIND